MKRMILTSVFAISIGIYGFSQNCNLAFKDGSKLTANILTFTNTEKKDDQVAAFNEDVISGKIKPASNSNMTFSIKKNALKNADEYSIGYNIAGVDYFSYVICSKDTLYIYRNKGPVPIGAKDNPIGYALQGAQVVPMNLKVGDVLPSFEDISFLFPTTADVTLKKSVFDGYATSHSTHWGYGTDSRTGESGIGEWDVTTSRAVFKDIDVKARKTVTVTGHSIQGVGAVVIGEEEVTVNGVKYKAYITESESWTKSNTKTSYQSADEELNKVQVEADKKMGKKLEKLMLRKQYINKQGYMVMYSKQWLVPQLGGAVKTISYDIYGGIAAITTVTGMN